MPIPVKKRQNVSAPSESAVALSSEATPKIVRLTSSSGRRPKRSPIRPAESAPTRMPMLEHVNASRECRRWQMPGLDQRRHCPGDGIEVVAVADLHQGAQRRNAKLQPADPLVLKRGLGRRHAVSAMLASLGVNSPFGSSCMAAGVLQAFGPTPACSIEGPGRVGIPAGVPSGTSTDHSRTCTHLRRHIRRSRARSCRGRRASGRGF